MTFGRVADGGVAVFGPRPIALVLQLASLASLTIKEMHPTTTSNNIEAQRFWINLGTILYKLFEYIGR